MAEALQRHAEEAREGWGKSACAERPAGAPAPAAQPTTPQLLALLLGSAIEARSIRLGIASRRLWNGSKSLSYQIDSSYAELIKPGASSM